MAAAHRRPPRRAAERLGDGRGALRARARDRRGRRGRHVRRRLPLALGLEPAPPRRRARRRSRPRRSPVPRPAAARPGLTIAVTNEVGLGVVPATPLGRAYRDLLGTVNRIWVEASERAAFVVAGRLLPLEAGRRSCLDAARRVVTRRRGASATPSRRSSLPTPAARGRGARRRSTRRRSRAGSLGRLEDLAVRRSPARGARCDPPPLAPVVVVAAGDHGIAREGVSAYPQEVTGQMLGDFATGGAAVAVLCRNAGARLVVVDAGVVSPPEPSGPPRPLARSGDRQRGRRAGDGASRRGRGLARGAALGRELAADGRRRRRARRDGHRQHDRRGGARVRAARLRAGRRLRPGDGPRRRRRRAQGRRRPPDARREPPSTRRPARRARRRRRLRARGARGRRARRRGRPRRRARSTGSSRASRRSSPRGSRRRSRATSSRRTARRSRGTRSSSRSSGSSRCSTSSCGSARAAAPRSRCRSSSRRGRSSSRWRRSTTRASRTRADDRAGARPGGAGGGRVPDPGARRAARGARRAGRRARRAALPARRRRGWAGTPGCSPTCSSRACRPRWRVRSPSRSRRCSRGRCTSTRSPTRRTRSAGRPASGRSRSCATTPIGAFGAVALVVVCLVDAHVRRCLSRLPATRRSSRAAVAGAGGPRRDPPARARAPVRAESAPGQGRVLEGLGWSGVVVGLGLRSRAGRRRRRAGPRRVRGGGGRGGARPRLVFRAWLGGVTGDALGATAKLCETGGARRVPGRRSDAARPRPARRGRGVGARPVLRLARRRALGQGPLAVRRRSLAALAPEPVAAVVSSPRVRAVETAAAIAEPHGLEVERRPRPARARLRRARRPHVRRDRRRRCRSYTRRG